MPSSRREGTMSKHVLITGGAGFIGSHLADELLARGYAVRVLDNLTPQVHDDDAGRPTYLDPQVELHEGDVRDAEAVARALDGVDAVVHLAARVGVGQSMYELAAYTEANSVGTAVLLEGLLDRRVERLVVASSMSVYGEGLYRDADGGRACRLALESDRAAGEAVNVGSGESASVLEIAHRLATVLGVEVDPELAGKSRAGDIRHCFADISRARELLGYEPQITLDDGMAELAEWLADQVAVDRADDAAAELAARGLTR